METAHPQFRTIKEIIQYWRECLNGRGAKSDEQVAAGIVEAGLFNDVFDEYYRKDKDFAAVYDIASDLEWSNGDAGDLAKGWEGVENLLANLEGRYKTRENKK